MTKKNLILAAAVAGMIVGVSGNNSAKAEDAAKTEETAAPTKAAKSKPHSEAKMKKKKGEMGCKAGQCGSEMKMDKKATPEGASEKPAAPAESK